MRKLLLATVTALALLAVAVPGASVANSADTSVCKRGGWQDLVRADRTAFASQGACVSYVARGGTPEPVSIFQTLCEGYGGTYVEDHPQANIGEACEGTDAMFSHPDICPNLVMMALPVQPGTGCLL
jgi:hypothetical protein